MAATLIPSLDTQPIGPRFERISVDRLSPSPNNPWATTDADPSLKELAESLRTLGQIEPIVVQEMPDNPERFEILAGERRWRASRIAGLSELEAKVIAPTEQQALEITVVENLQRRDPDPIREARGVATLLSKGWDVPTIASHLGKSVRWVHMRSGLTKLTKEWTEALSEPTSIVSRFSAGHLELVARLTPEQQDVALHQVDKLAKEWDGSVVTVEDFADGLAGKFTHDLSAARFDLNDAELVPKAGACSACPKRSSCQLELFSDLSTGKKKTDHCLDEKCWDKKDSAWLKAKEKAAREEHGDHLVKIDPQAYYGTGKVLGEGQYSKAKADAKGAVPALVVGDGNDAGKTVWIKPHAKPENDGPDVESPASKAKRERAKLLEDRSEHIHDAIYKAMKANKQPKRPDDQTLIRLAAVCMDEYDDRGLHPKAFDPKVKLEALRDNLWATILERLTADDCEVAVCELIGLDHTALVASAAQAFPDISEGVAEAAAPKPEKAKTTKKSNTKKITKKAKKKGAA